VASGCALTWAWSFLGSSLRQLAPALFRGQRAFLVGGQIAVNGAPTRIETAGGLDFGTARVEEFYHRSQVQGALMPTPLPLPNRLGEPSRAAIWSPPKTR